MQGLSRSRAAITAAGAFLAEMTIYVAAGETHGEIIDVFEQGPNGQHMIFWKIQGLKFDEVDTFLNAGVDIEVRGFRGATPIIWAASGVNWDMVLFLRERGADLSASDRDGMSVCTIQEGLPTRLDTENGPALEEMRRILKERELC